MDATAAIELAKAGIVVLKTGRDGRSKATIVTLSQDCRQLEWGQRKSSILSSKKASLGIKVKQATDRMLLLEEIMKLQFIPAAPPTKRPALVILVEDESSAATARTTRAVTKKGIKIHPALVISAAKDGEEPFKMLYEALLAVTPKQELAQTPRAEEPILPTEEELAAVAEKMAAEKAAAEEAAAKKAEAQRNALVTASQIVEEVLTAAVLRAPWAQVESSLESSLASLLCCHTHRRGAPRTVAPSGVRADEHAPLSPGSPRLTV